MSILNDVAQFAGVARYHGTMPSRHASAYRDEDIARLVDAGLMEWARFTYGCGKEINGLRLTTAGRRLLAENSVTGEASDPGNELTYEHLLILQDVHHFSRMPRYRRMMPEKKARYYPSCDFEDLLSRGYILKMKLKVQGERTLKGYVISAKGERALDRAKLD